MDFFSFRRIQLISVLIVWGCTITFYSTPQNALAQTIHEDRDTTEVELGQRINRAPYVYIDCGFCDFNHIRTEIDFVNYVRDPEQADIHVFATRTRTAGGGVQYDFSFIGLRSFSDISFDLKHLADRNETSSETREHINKLLKTGFMPYINQTPLAPYFSISYDGVDIEIEEDLLAEDDPWDYWIFEAYLGSVSLGLETNRTDFDSRWGLFADRVTEDWKLRFRPYFNYSLIEIKQEEDDDVRSTFKRHGLDTYAIKSINDHWSAGLFATYITRNDRNIRNRYQVNPGVEYSFLPYQLATRKAITLQYQIGYTYIEYFEETIFGKEKEQLLNHSLQGSVSIQQTWGNIAGGIIGSHYFHDASLRRAVFFGRVSLRITEGLSFNFRTNFQMIQDQLSLPAGDASLEEILLQQRELATDYSLSGSIAISYTFGSDYANIVNTRF